MNDFKWTKTFATAFLCLSLLGCATEQQEEEVVRQTEVKIEKEVKVEEEQANVIEAISPLKDLDKNANKLNLPLRNGVIPPAPEMTYRLADYLKKISKDPATFDEKLPLSLKLPNVPLEEAIIMFKETLGFEYILDAGVKGTVRADIDLQGDKAISRYDAWKLFEEILYMGGSYATYEPSGVIKISPFIKMSKEKRLLIKGDPKGNAVVEMVQLVRTPAMDVLNNLRPFMTDGASATVLTKSNSILLVETPANMEKLHALIKMLDNKGQAGWPQLAYECKEIDSATIMAELQTLIPILGFTVSAGNAADPSGVKVGSIDRISVIVLSAPTLDALSEIKRWIEILDSADAGEQEKVYFYPVKHGVATDLVDAITTFFPETTTGGRSTSAGGSGGSSTSSRAGGSARGGSSGRVSANQLNRNPSSPARPSRPATSNGVRANGATAEPISIFDMPVTAFEDTRRNQLVIRSTPRTYAMLQAILNHLDAPPMQVLIQVTAVEVNLNEGLQYGFEYAAEAKFGQGTGTVGVGTSEIVAAAIGPAGSVNPGISALLQSAGVENEFAFAQAVAGETDTRMLFCPQILTMNGEEAQINVGQEVPIKTSNSTSNSGSDIENIEYRDTGTILTVVPQISSDKRVTLDINVELSSLSVDTVDGISSPIFNENTITNRLIVNDKETILLGGIITKSETDSNSGVPILKDIPGIGWLFGGTTTSQSNKELVIFVKATVVESKSDYQNMVLRYKQALKYKAKSPELDK